MAKKRVTRKQLLNEPDEFLTLSARLIEIGVKYKSQVTAAGIGLLILVVAIAGFRYYSAKSESRSFTLLSRAMIDYNGIATAEGPAAGFLGVEDEFKSLIKKYGGTSGGKLAQVVYADMSVKGGYPDTAIALYKKALNDFESQPLIKGKILLGLAYALEEKKAYKDAAEYLEMMTAVPGAVGTAEATYNLGRIYGLLGDQEKSRKMYEKVLADYPDFIYADLIKMKLVG